MNCHSKSEDRDPLRDLPILQRGGATSPAVQERSNAPDAEKTTKLSIGDQNGIRTWLEDGGQVGARKRSKNKRNFGVVQVTCVCGGEGRRGGHGSRRG